MAINVVLLKLSLIATICRICSTEAISRCDANLVETIPEDLTYNETITSVPTYEGLLKLITSAKYSIDVASFYWTLQGPDVMTNPVPESKKGEDILNALISSAKTSEVKVRIAVNDDKDSYHSNDLNKLQQYCQIRRVNFTRLVGAGILHTKFIIVDKKHLYIGSANMDWRSLTHVKEMGLIVNDCSSLAQDLLKIFEIYWYLGDDKVVIPEEWPAQYSTKYNKDNQLNITINSDRYDVYLTSSPKELCSKGRTNDIEAIVSIINSADKFIYIAVMDYYPIFLYKYPTVYWPVIEDALKRAAIERNVEVHLLASHWNHTRDSMKLFLKSLSALQNVHILKGTIETRLFTVPAFTPIEREIPFARVNHNKYMVTDKVAYIGTSNWSADYFVSTGGVGIAFNTTSTNQLNMHSKLKSAFERDWNSVYSQVV